MKEYLEDSRCLASLAVFKELYDNKKDIYAVICEFIIEAIKLKRIYQFSLTEITSQVNDIFDFNILDAVIKTALKRIKFITKAGGSYIIDSTCVNKWNNDVSIKQLEIEKNNACILYSLFTFTEQIKSIQLTDSDKSNITKSLCAYLLDESVEDEYSESISAFIVKCQMDKSLLNQLNNIKKGVVLYTGLKYNSNINKIGNWDTNLTIYIETEILFHLAGYNGSLCKELFYEFYNLIKEINTGSINKTGKKKIHLLYFTEVKNEIERFFNKAEAIVEAKETLDPSKTAMASIVNGCQSASDIIVKKSSFYELLRCNGIEEASEEDFYNKKNYVYCIEDEVLINHLQGLYSTKKNGSDINENLKFLNYINIFRKGNSDVSFENIGAILLTGNSTTIKIAWDEKIKKNGNIPLATTLSFITNKLWFRLGKGLGNNTDPKSFDIVTKAQVVLSTQINDSVAEKYDKLQSKYKNGEINKETATVALISLRSQVKTPENIKNENLDDIIDCISETSIEKLLEEQKHQNLEKKRIEDENILLKKKIQRIEICQKETAEQLIELQSQRNNDKMMSSKNRHSKLCKYVNHKFIHLYIVTLLKVIGYLISIAMAIYIYYFDSWIKDVTIIKLTIISKTLITFGIVILPIVLSKFKYKVILKNVYYVLFPKYRRCIHQKYMRNFIRRFDDQVNR